MKYMLLIYSTEAREEFDALAEEEQNAIFAEYMAIQDEPDVLGGDQLQPTDSATTVRVANGETLTTDGPFSEPRRSSAATTCSRRTTSTAPLRSRRGFPRPAWAGPSRSARWWSAERARARLARGAPAGPRHPDRLPRRLRSRRGRPSGGVRARGRPVAPRRDAAQSASVARHDSPGIGQSTASGATARLPRRPSSWRSRCTWMT